MSFDLTVDHELEEAPQFIEDQLGHKSPLAIGTGQNIGIGTDAPQEARHERAWVEREAHDGEVGIELPRDFHAGVGRSRDDDQPGSIF